MVKYLIIICLAFCCCKSVLNADGATETITVYNELAKDSFDIRIDIFNHSRKHKNFEKIVFYFDAGIKSGTKIRDFFGDTANSNTLLVGIAHKGYFREKRRRDLMENNNNLKQLLDSSIIPYIKAKYGWSDERIIIGHSFGGLWVYRSFFSADTMFTTYLAISPSLWVEGTKQPLDYDTRTLEDKKLIMYWGRDEEFNYVKGACKKADEQIKTNTLLSSKIERKELEGESHNSTVTPALQNYFSK